MLMQFSTTGEPVKFNAQAIITSLTGATTILIQLSPAGLIPGLMLMQLSPTTLDHDQFSCNFQLVPTKFCNAHLMQHYNYHQIRWILTENWMRINISLLLGYSFVGADQMRHWWGWYLMGRNLWSARLESLVLVPNTILVLGCIL